MRQPIPDNTKTAWPESHVVFSMINLCLSTFPEKLLFGLLESLLNGFLDLLGSFLYALAGFADSFFSILGFSLGLLDDRILNVGLVGSFGSGLFLGSLRGGFLFSLDRKSVV